MASAMDSTLTHDTSHVPWDNPWECLCTVAHYSVIIVDSTSHRWDVDTYCKIIIPWLVSWDCGSTVGVNTPQDVRYLPVGPHGTSHGI